MLSYFLPRYLCPTAIKGILKACKAPVVSLNSTGAPIPMTPEKRENILSVIIYSSGLHEHKTLARARLVCIDQGNKTGYEKHY